MAAGLSWMLLVGAITLGMAVPRVEYLNGFGANGKLDYSAHASDFSPLSLAFIADILGLDSPPIAVAPGSEDEALATSAGTSTSGVVTAAPVDVEHPFTNDDFQGAYKVSSLPFRGRTDTSSASRRSREPSECFPSGGTAWYRYRPQTQVALFSDTFGTPRATALGVYQRGAGGALKLVGCDANTLGNAQVGFRAKANTTYFFQVTAMVKGGPTVFELAAVGPTTVVTLTPDGKKADDPIVPIRSEISADGRYIAFASAAQNLAPVPPGCQGSTNCDFLFLHDRLTGKTRIVTSVRSPLERSFDIPLIQDPVLSADGRYLAFSIIGETFPRSGFGFQGAPDAEENAINPYLYDLTTGRHELLSRNSAGEASRADPVIRSASGQGPYLLTGSMNPSMTPEGRYVTFISDGANLGGHVERSKVFNVYRRDRETGITRLVSTDSKGRPMRANSWACTGRNLSGDGRYVFFRSTHGTSNEGDMGHTGHLYLWDASTGRTRLVTRVPKGTQVKGSYCPAISMDGSRTAFVSHDALVPEDTNGTPDVYSYEVATREIRRVSVTSAGEQTNDVNFYSAEGSAVLPRSVTLSADGRYVAFDSSAPELVPTWVGGTRHTGSRAPGPIQVFIHDHVTGATILASVSSTGEPLPGNSIIPYISADGSAVSFLNSSRWTDENSVTQLDVMVHELTLRAR